MTDVQRNIVDQMIKITKYLPESNRSATTILLQEKSDSHKMELGKYIAEQLERPFFLSFHDNNAKY